MLRAVFFFLFMIYTIPSAQAMMLDPATVAAKACKVDSDCLVMDVGSCCGVNPQCMNRDHKPDPAAVKKQCEAQGVSSICGFMDIESCTCNDGWCAPVLRDTPYTNEAPQ